MLMIRIVSLFLVLTFSLTASAREGMWIPSTLAKLVIGDMQDEGLKLSAEDIYSINQSSLKDAIVHFNGGCTASVISEEGLILTNHHCGFSQIQYHSSLENDYLKNGFWAASFNEELPNQDLVATFVIRIEDVTTQLMSAKEGLEGQEASRALESKAADLINQAKEGTHYEAEIKPFFYGNAYYLIVTETYEDVRLVGAPPSSIGKFGGDTDNWEWPRHTGDFSLFRIYAGPDNKPAPYSVDNVPYKPRHSLPVSMKGVEENDFTMVFGFPGRTDQYLSAAAVKFITEEENPARIAMREASLGVIDAAMESSDLKRIQYAAKQSRISNAYKKWIGQNGGLERFYAIEKKENLEKEFSELAEKSSEFSHLSNVSERFESLYADYGEARLARTYLIEMYYYGPEVLRFSSRFENLAENYDSLKQVGALDAELEKLASGIDGFYKNYDRDTDLGIFTAQLPVFLEGAPQIISSSTLNSYVEKYRDPQLVAEAIYAKSIFDDQDQVELLVSGDSKKLLKKLSEDPVLKIGAELLDTFLDEVRKEYVTISSLEDDLMKDYLKAMMVLMPDKKYFPDANSTLRLTYGKVEGTEPVDGLEYKHYTTLDGIMAKYVPDDKEFDVPKRLIDLHRTKDYGQYATNGELRVCFLGSNHTTGGNSGSPAIGANGELVGLNFDRTWQSTMSDIMFNDEVCRNIMVDIKYVLFIIDKFAGADHLVQEMNLVYPKPADFQDRIRNSRTIENAQ
jgi:hypothetical protein